MIHGYVEPMQMFFVPQPFTLTALLLYLPPASSVLFYTVKRV